MADSMAVWGVDKPAPWRRFIVLAEEVVVKGGVSAPTSASTFLPLALTNLLTSSPIFLAYRFSVERKSDGKIFRFEVERTKRARIIET